MTNQLDRPERLERASGPFEKRFGSGSDSQKIGKKVLVPVLVLKKLERRFWFRFSKKLKMILSSDQRKSIYYLRCNVKNLTSI